MSRTKEYIHTKETLQRISNTKHGMSVSGPKGVDCVDVNHGMTRLQLTWPEARALCSLIRRLDKVT